MPRLSLERLLGLIAVGAVGTLLALAIPAYIHYRHSRPDLSTVPLPSIPTTAGTATAQPSVTTGADASVTGTPLVWRGDFDTGDFSQWSEIQALPGRVTIVTNHVRQGKYAARFELRSGDQVTRRGERAEISKITDESAGQESWWAWSTYFPANRFFVETDGTVIFTQWHDPPPYFGKPPVLFGVQNSAGVNYLFVSVRGGDARAPTVKTWRLGDLQMSHWYDFVFHVKWESDRTGLVELWLDGTKVVPLTHIPTLYQGKPVYLKQGNYRHPFDKTSVLYQDGTRRGMTHASLGGAT
ncbi:MAG: hypothetical protein E6G67_01025 [Actinobacteria bacterium]|nr:MAG: hypothetical protein E6G67_01025 [Actinomycetota bacterium]